MNYLLALAMVFALVSCNTGIGMYRDGKAAFEWTRSQFQDGGGAYEEQYGPPIY